MDLLRHLLRGVASRRSNVVELAGLGIATLGVGDVYLPAGLMFAGAALVFIAQGMERHE